MRANKIAWLMLLIAVASARAQVLSPFEIQDPAMRRLQQEHMEDLKAIGTNITQHSFPYPFYFSRKLDIDESIQKQLDQRSIRFERYNGQTALEITGNYYASYSAVQLDGDHRVRETYLNVIRPMLQAAVPPLAKEKSLDAFAFEISHHLRKKVMGVDTEYPENVVVIIPRELAAKVIASADESAQQELMKDAEVYLDSQPSILWLTGEKPSLDESRNKDKSQAKKQPKAAESTAEIDPPTVHSPELPIQLTARNVPEELRDAPLHDSSPQALQTLLDSHKDALDSIVRELDSTAHFVAYAPPSFIAFKQGAYLQLSFTTDLDANAAGSQYRLAALAFDRHVSHLLRPVLARLGDTSHYDGIDFSTTVKVAGDKSGTYTQAVEFVLPMAALHCYQQLDCTGQQLLNKGYVLVNGERIGLDLQSAEGQK